MSLAFPQSENSSPSFSNLAVTKFTWNVATLVACVTLGAKDARKDTKLREKKTPERRSMTTIKLSHCEQGIRTRNVSVVKKELVLVSDLFFFFQQWLYLTSLYSIKLSTTLTLQKKIVKLTLSRAGLATGKLNDSEE